MGLRGTLFLALAAAAAAVQALAETGVTAKEIVIGNCADQSGSNKELGASYAGGAQAYFEHLNSKGGVHGRKIRLVRFDDGYEPDKAIDCFSRLQKEGIFAFGFAVGSPTGAKYVQLAQSQKVPFLGLTAGAPFMYDPKNNYVFAGRASYAAETREHIDHLWNDLGVRRVGVIYQADAFGAGGLDGVKLALKKYGAEIVAQGSYPRNTVEIEDAYKQVRAANPEAVILVAIAKPAAEVLKKAYDDGWRPYFLTVAGRDSILAKAAGPAAEGVIIANATPPMEHGHLPTVALHNSLIGKHAPNAIPGTSSVQGFAEALILAEGLKRAGKNPTRAGLVAALESIKDFDPGLGPDYRFSYGPGDHTAFERFSFSRIRNGAPEVFSDWKALKKAAPTASR